MNRYTVFACWSNDLSPWCDSVDADTPLEAVAWARAEYEPDAGGDTLEGVQVAVVVDGRIEVVL